MIHVQKQDDFPPVITRNEKIYNVDGELYFEEEQIAMVSMIPGTNLAVANRTGSTLDVTSDTGTDATIPPVSITEAGLMTAADKVALDAIAGGGPFQPLDGDLSDIAAILAANDDLMQYKAGVWTNRTPAQVKTDLVLVKGDVGLGNVDNTSDVNKPVSTAQAAADAVVLASAEAYADALVVGLVDDRGNFDASGGAYPSSGGSGTAGAILKGDLWTISVAGTLPTGQPVTPGDVIRALVDTPGNIEANWARTENNFGYVAENSANKDTDGTMAANSNTRYPSQAAVVTYVGAQVAAAAVPDATETVKGKAEIATDSETQTGTDDARITTPLKLANWWTNIKTLAASISGIWTFTKELILSDISAPGVTTNKLYSVAGWLQWFGSRIGLWQVSYTPVGSRVVETDVNGYLIDVVKATAYNKAFGTGATDVCVGNDSRLSDDRKGQTRLFAYSRTTVASTNVTSEEALASIQIPAGTLGNNDEIEIFALYSGSGAGTKNARCRLHTAAGTGGTIFYNIQSGTFASGQIFQRIVMKNASNAQESAPNGIIIGASASAVITATLSNASDIYINLTSQKATGTDGLSLNNYSIKINHA